MAFALGATAFACGSKGSKSDDCTKGSEGCSCDEGTCAPGLSCLSMLCVDPGASKGGSTNGGTGGVGNAAGGGKLGSAGGVSSSGGTSASSSTPVALHGALSVNGANLVDGAGAPVKLEGMSSMWLNWDPAGYATSKEGLRWMRDNWNLRVLRAAMGVAPEGQPTSAYLGNKEKYKAQVNQIVQNAVDLGVYVIIDWHDHEALAHQAEAVAFFQEMSARWGGYPNVLYEVFNEPLALNWQTQLKPYHQALVTAIRANDPDNVILLGTPNWDQDVDVAAMSPLSGTNLMYTLHFYACTHQAAIRSKAQTARSRGLPLFVSEWGATHSDGGLDGVVCESEARVWHDWLDANNISWAAWKLDGCKDSSCMFKDQTAAVSGGWTSAQLNGHAPLVIDEMKNDPPSGTGGTSGSGGASGKGGAPSGGAPGSGGASSVGQFPPNPAGCVVVSSCASCCSTSGVFAIDSLYQDATSRAVTSFSVNASSVSAAFSFSGPDEVGSIFFALSAPANISELALGFTGGGGLYEVALVSGGGTDGCIYPIDGNSLASGPSTCWGNGAGPSKGLPVDQIEIRLRSLGSGNGSLVVSKVEYF